MNRSLVVAAAVALTALLGHVLSLQLRPSKAEYAWLVFGPTAGVRILAAVTGDTITLQRFDGEKPVGREERFKDRGQRLEILFTDPDGVTSYVIRKCATPPPHTPGGKDGVPTELFVNVEIHGPVEYRQYCDATMSREPGKAPVSHFHGPLAIGPYETPSDLALHRGEEGTDLRVVIGTLDAARGCWVVVKSHDLLDQTPGGTDRCLFPAGVRPVADIAFPPKKPGDPPIRRRYVLDGFC
jgi:hypothetical protein